MFRRLIVAATIVSLSVQLVAQDARNANYDEAKIAPYTLPELLVASDGTRVATPEAWRNKRRPELLELFSREMYGRTPGGRPAQMHWTVDTVDRSALGGKAVRREVTIWLTERRDGPKIHVLIYQPAASVARGPWPTFVGLNYFGNQSVNHDPGIRISTGWVRSGAGVTNNRATDATRGLQAGRWVVEDVVARGYATVTAHYGDICPDRPEGLTEGIGALFGTAAVGQRKSDEWGAIGIWAWGLSRIMDYIASDAELDGSRVIVHGHSRLGKAALWAGAQDERFAAVISNDSGNGGPKISRRVYGETLARITTTFPHWFAERYKSYGNREQTLPFDQHQLLALIAPRPLYVASAEDDQWADPRGEFLGLVHAEPAYHLFGKLGLGTSAMPKVNRPVAGDVLAYHIRSGPHDIKAYDWAQYLNFADKVLKRSPSR